MNLKSQIEVQGYGTSEGVQKEWDERGRGKSPSESKRELFKVGRDVNFALPREQGLRPTNDAMKTAAKKLGIKPSLARKAWESYSFDIDGQAAGGQTDSSSFIGRKFRTEDTRYGHSIGEYDTPEEAEKAARARPYTRVVSWPKPENSQKLRDIARKRMVSTNPDVT